MVVYWHFIKVKYRWINFFHHKMAFTMRGESDIPTIFNPHRVRAPPNLVVTGEGASRGSVPNGPFGHSAHALQHSDSGKL